MSINDDLAKELLGVFALEAGERLQAINEHLLALEKALGVKEVDRLLAEIFREAHSLKGAARAVNLPTIEAVAHRLESLLLEMQTGVVGRDREIFDLIYEAADAIGTLTEEGPGASESAVDVDDLGARLEAAIKPRSEASNGEGPAAVPGTMAEEAEEEGPVSEGQQGASTETAEAHPHWSAISGTPARADETVRVTTAKLDDLFGHVGELLAARVGAEKRLADVRALQEEVDGWKRSWRRVRPSYRRFLIDIEAAGSSSLSNGNGAEINDVVTFLEESDRHLRSAAERLTELGHGLESDTRTMAQLTNDIHDDVRRTRMMPVQTVFQSFPRMVRDISNASGKQVELEIHGADTEVDRSVLEHIGAPLTHLLRNCIDHGIEDPETRREMGKLPQGKIVLQAGHHGDSVRVEVTDDGRGIDVKKVIEKAVAQEVISPEEAESLDEREALWLIFRSGLSTSPLITDISGRGIGLDVVRETIERLHGRIDVESQPGEGTSFSLILPLTLATTFCLMVESSGQSFGIPITNVLRIMRLEPNEIVTAQAREVIKVDGQPLPLARLENVLGLASTNGDNVDGSRRLVAPIVASGEKRIALLVDGVLGAQEIVQKNLPRPLGGTRYVAGASILGTGELVMVLNAAEVVRTSGDAVSKPASQPAKKEEDETASIIIADDSITTRTLERNILEAAGYSVRVAADGIEAWTLLQQNGCDLLVSDVNMPRMDGFHLTERVRSDPRFHDLPVILVTSLDKPEDRERGIDAGADAYIVKGSFDQDRLLETIRRLI